MSNSWKNKKVAILGWGINGSDAAEFLIEKGADITVFDLKEEEELDFGVIDKSKLKLILGNTYLKKGLKNFDVIFRAPGVYRYLPEIVEAEKRGTIVTSVTDLFFDLCPAKIIGVTGTKGKGTTSTLIYEILKKGGFDIHLAGNIGAPMLRLLPKLKITSWVVLELSSFQLIDMARSPHMAVVLNITEDHMDWHKNREEYVDAKLRIVKFQNPTDYAILNYDFEASRKFAKHTQARVYYFSKDKEVLGSFVKDNEINIDDKSKNVKLGDVNSLLLRGRHNWENVCAASCAAYLAGVRPNIIKDVIFLFRGLEHRLELVREVNGVTYYNDSFSTNPQTALAAINAFEEPLTVILGGFDKGLKYEEIAEGCKSKTNITNVILIGDIADRIKDSLTTTKFAGKIYSLGKSNMKDIVKKCIQITPKGGVVLLSPGSSSFDMFKDYKDRGNQFKTAVSLL